MQNFNIIRNYVFVISDAFYVHDDYVTWWVDHGTTSPVFKDLCWFKECQPIDDGSVVNMGNVATEPINGLWSVLLDFTFRKYLC